MTNTKEKVLIAGCGKLGCPLGEVLISDGYEVHGIRRNLEGVPQNIRSIQADLTQQLDDLPTEFDYIYYIVSAESRNDLAYYQAYSLGVKHLLETVNRSQKEQPKRIFFVSSTSVFGQTDADIVDENSPVSEHSFSTKRLLEGEALIENCEIPSTIIRFGGIYGPGRTHLIDLVSDGKARCLDGVYSNRIHSDDCVGILQHLLKVETPESLYIGVDSQPALTCEVYEWLAEQLAVSDIEYLEPTEHNKTSRSNKRLSNARILASGYQFKYPDYQAGYKELLDDYLHA